MTEQELFSEATRGKFVPLPEVWMVYLDGRAKRAFVRRTDALDWAVFLRRQFGGKARITRKKHSGTSAACRYCGALFVADRESDEPQMVCACLQHFEAWRDRYGRWHMSKAQP